MALLLTELPPELLSKCFSYLSGTDLANVGRVCKIFRDSINIEHIWRCRCLHEFRVNKIDTSILSYHQAYTNLLYRWAYLLGSWVAELKGYGGLVHVKFTGGEIEATEYLAPPASKVRDPLRQRRLFSVRAALSQRSAECICHRGHRYVPHPAQIFEGHNDGDDEEKFVYKCCNSSYHRNPAHGEGRRVEFLDWFREESGTSMPELDQNNDFHDLLLMKFTRLLQFDAKMECTRLHWPKPVTSPVPIQPGLFKGTYGAHGIELIMLDYNTEEHQAQCVKITGDPNVPAGKLTIQADLQRPMILNMEQQASVVTLSEIDTPDISPDVTLDQIPHQPFVVPRDCLDRFPDTPTRCRYRFHSQGQIARHGFTNASFTPGHWVVFNDDMFGHVWMELRSLSIYCRVQEQFAIS